MGWQSIELATDARGVAQITLNQPERHNVLSGQTIAELTEVARQIASDPRIRAVVLTGAGKSFCAGGDLGWMKDQINADRATRIAEAGKLAGMLRALYELPKPLIGRINGQAYGGGVGMISVCDLAIANEAACFGLTETRLGLIPATISPYVVARLTPPRAREIFSSAKLFGSDDAVRLGLIARAVPESKLDAAVEAEVAPYLSAAPQAVAAAKALLRRLSQPIGDAEITMTIEALADCWEGPEAIAGITAFFDKRPTPWASQG